MTDNLERCSFCGAVPRENEQLIEGLNANIAKYVLKCIFTF